MKKLYYLRDYTDEVLPCEPTLEGWAAWLAGADEGWGRDEAANPGETFVCDLMERLPNIVAKLVEGVWVTPPLDAGTGYQNADFFAVACGGGWDHEQAGETPQAALGDAEGWWSDGDEVELAVCRDLPSIMVRFEIGEDGPRLVEAGPVQ